MTPPPGRGLRQLPAIAAAALLTGCGVAPVTLPAPAPTTTHVTPPQTPAVSSPPSTAATQQPSPTPVATRPAVPALSIESVSNFRDAAGSGPGIALADGGVMAQGVVYRAGRLTDLSASDRKELAAAGITDIFDLRTTKVARRSPDRPVEGAAYHLINLFGVYATPSRSFRSLEAARADRERINREFVAEAEQRRRTAKVLTAIASADGPVIVHCTEGKDRTGWIAALLQLTAGASREDVTAQYLLSNTYRKAVIDKRYATVKAARGKRAAEIDQVARTVDAAFLEAGLAELDRRYGSLDDYLTEGLGLSPKTVDKLRERLRS